MFDDENEPAEIRCLLDGARGIYVPQGFAECFDMDGWHVKAEDEEILLAGPDHEFYWDAWSDVLNYAWFDSPSGKLTLEQDSDLFAVRYA